VLVGILIGFLSNYIITNFEISFDTMKSKTKTSSSSVTSTNNQKCTISRTDLKPLLPVLMNTIPRPENSSFSILQQVLDSIENEW
jgi:hypothetical protein